MERRSIGIVMNGVTGRMGYRQHLLRSILAIRERGGVPAGDGAVLWPEPVLVGRSEAKLRDLAGRHGLTAWTTDLAEALARPGVEVYFGGRDRLHRPDRSGDLQRGPLGHARPGGPGPDPFPL